MPRRRPRRDRGELPVPWRFLVRLIARVGHLEDLEADFEDLYRDRRHRDGALAAGLWLTTQLLRSPLALARTRQPTVPADRGSGSIAILARHAGRSAMRLLRFRGSPAVPFVLLVGLGVAAAASMIQVRESMRYPDLGIPVDVHRVRWQTTDGRPRTTLPADLAFARPDWTVAGAQAVVPIASRSIPLETPVRWVDATVQTVPPSFLATLGVRPALGRDVAAVGDVVLSHAFWRANWAIESPIGAELAVSGANRYRVVGVAPPEFDGPICCIRPAAWLVPGNSDWPAQVTLLAIGLGHAETAAAALASRLSTATEPVTAVTFIDARSRDLGVDQTLRLLLWLALVAFGGTLLNGANLLLADLAGRHREMALRRALGASSRTLFAGIALESAWLAAGAGLVGAAGAAALMRLAPAWIPMLNTPDLAVDLQFGWPAVAATTTAAVATALLIGVPVGLVAARGRSASLLDRTTGGSTRSARALRAILALQVALATALAAASLLHRDALSALDGDFVGFREGRTALYFTSSIPDTPAGDLTAIVTDLEASPGIAAVAVSRSLPVYGAPRVTVALGAVSQELFLESATAGYFDALGLTITAGDRPRHASEAVLSADAAGRMARAPSTLIGATLEIGDERVRITGIAEAATWGTGDWRPTLYRGWAPDKAPAPAVLLVRPSAGAPAPALSLVADSAARAGLALSPFGTLDSVLVRSRVLGEFLARSAGVFSTLCLLVALGGISAHFRRWVRSCRRDLGIRLCLGATPSRARGEVYRVALAPLVAGLGAGSVVAWFGGRLMAALMPEVPGSPLVPTIAAMAIVAALSLCTLIRPAVLAGRTDPLAILRQD